jgi:hypothetical protein
MFPRENPNLFRNSNADVQFFYGTQNDSSATGMTMTWSKPVGVSHIYMLLIGGGGNGNGTVGGGSGAVTTWYGAAQNVPDNLVIQPSTGSGGLGSSVLYRSSSSTLVTLIRANPATATTGGTVFTANQFCNSGFFQSVAGQAGSSNIQNSSNFTFLSGGNINGAGQQTANYGYDTTSQATIGFLLLQPIIVGIGNTKNANLPSAIGCGACAYIGSLGGTGMVLIASW